MKWVEDSYEKGGSNGGSEKKGGIQKGGSNKKKGGSKAGSHKKVGGKAAGSGKDVVNDKILDENVSKYVCLCFFLFVYVFFVCLLLCYVKRNIYCFLYFCSYLCLKAWVGVEY